MELDILFHKVLLFVRFLDYKFLDQSICVKEFVEFFFLYDI